MDKNLQEKYLEYQVLQQTLNQLYQKKSIIQNQINEFSNLKDNLDSLKKSNKNSPMYAAFGSGVFAKAELKETDTVLVNIGSNIAIERSVEDSKKLVDAQVQELSSLLKQIDKNIEENIERTGVLGKKLSEAQNKEKQHNH